MATAFPASLPQVPELATWSETLPNNLIRSQPDAGPPKVRRRFTAGVYLCQATITLTSDAQLATFDTFFNTTLIGGSQRFTWYLPPSGGTNEYLFAGPPEIVALGGSQYRVSMSLLRFQS